MRTFQNRFKTILAALSIIMSFKSTYVSAFVSADQPTLGMSTVGDIISIWSVYDNANGSYVIRAKTYDSINNWSSNTTISTIPGTSFSPLLVVNSAGNAAAIWTCLDAYNIPTLQGNIYYNGAWNINPTQLSATDASVSSYQLKLCDNGILTVIWSSFPQGSSESVIYALVGSTVAGGWNIGSGITVISD